MISTISQICFGRQSKIIRILRLAGLLLILSFLYHEVNGQRSRRRFGTPPAVIDSMKSYDKFLGVRYFSESDDHQFLEFSFLKPERPDSWSIFYVLDSLILYTDQKPLRLIDFRRDTVCFDSAGARYSKLMFISRISPGQKKILSLVEVNELVFFTLHVPNIYPEGSKIIQWIYRFYLKEEKKRMFQEAIKTSPL